MKLQLSNVPRAAVTEFPSYPASHRQRFESEYGQVGERSEDGDH